MNIFKQYFYSIFKPQEYQNMAKLGAGRIFLYLLLLSLFTSILTFANPVISYFKVGGIETVIDNYLPEFKFKDNTFQTDIKINKIYDTDDLYDIEDDLTKLASADGAEQIRPYLLYFISKEFDLIGESYENISAADSSQIAEQLANDLESAKFYLYIDTSTNTVAEALESGDIDFSKTKIDDAIIITKNDFSFLDSDRIDDFITSGQFTSFNYDSIFEEEISLDNKDITTAIQQILPILYIVVAVFLVLFILFSMLGWFIAGIVYSLVALIVSKIMKKDIAYGQLLKIAIYAQTTIIILKAILSLVSVHGVIITYGGYIITIAYIIFAIQKYTVITYNPYNNGQGFYNNPYNNRQDFNNNPYNNGQNFNNNPYNNGQNTTYEQQKNNSSANNDDKNNN